VTTLLISDLHLDPGKPHLSAILQQFLAGPARQADALYLLGDVFEAWVGDDDDSPFVRDIEAALRGVADSGVSVYFMVGNRDFLVREAFAHRAGLTLISDPMVVTLGGVKTLLTHGDRYCTDDVAYQGFRAKSRTEAWQRKILRYPLWLRRWIARRARKKSMAQHKKNVAAGYISDVVSEAYVAEMQQLAVKRLIHGHTHRPADHRVELPDGDGERLVLADWREDGEALEIRDDGTFVRMKLSA
jgi:UDP-2,3-diacylglucosamine hydrolase